MTYSIKTLELGSMANLIYLVTDNATQKTAVVDPAWDTKSIITTCEQMGVAIDQIWLTHAHHDHVNGVADIVDYYDCDTHLLKAEIDYWNGDINRPIRHYGGDVLKLGETEVEILHTPGHSKGSACYHLGKDILTGDTLFVFGCGHCKLEGGNPEVLYKTLKKMKQELDDELIILPGHNYAHKISSNMQEQKEGNPFLLCNTQEDFIEYRQVVHDKTRKEPYKNMTLFQVRGLLSGSL